MTNENTGLNVPPALPSQAETKPTVGYCRACGLALNAETVRQSMGTLYCAEHAPAQATTPPPPPGTGDSPYTSPYAVPPPIATPNADVNPGLAFFLGLIPGVGAIYNGQYAKGLVHAIVFGMLGAIADSDTPLDTLFGFMMPVFLFYMAFEAYHTAKSRQAGLVVDEFSSIIPSDKRAAAFPIVPILLIVAGVFFLLINFELVSFRYLIRWWPAGLIALGGYLLWDRLNANSNSGGINNV
jgi:hypothetical protein